MKKFRTMSREEYKKESILDYMTKWNDSEERAIEQTERDIVEMENKSALMDEFEAFINNKQYNS